MKKGLDYVFVSYYEDDCNNYQPNWQRVFDSLHVIFPFSMLGIGECGTVYADRKETYINRYYRMDITTLNYVGGYFWWYYKQDCVPYTKYLWGVIDRAMCLLPEDESDNANGFGLQNYPNPFNPKTIISYELRSATGGTGFVRLIVFDVLGKEIVKVVNRQQNIGKYAAEFDGSALPSGIYYYMIDVNGVREIKKMVLVK
jgi:hypothetical protein